MREIKFRTWDVDEEEWYNNEKIPYQLIDNEGVFYWADDYEWDRYPGEVLIMQYTGLKDKNGTEIYEGDVVKGSYYAGYNIGIKRIIGNVSWTSASFKVNGVKQYEGTRVGLDGSFEVIGNVYENPELLGDSQ